MSYFGTPQTPLAGRAELFQANPDFQSLLDASAFDLGTPSELTETTAAPATGPSGSLGASSLQPNNPYGLDVNTLSDDKSLTAQALLFRGQALSLKT